MVPNISEEDNKLFLQKINDCREEIARITARENEYLLLAKNSPEEAALTHLTLAEETLNIALYHLEIDSASREFHGTKNEKALDEGRKSVYKCLSYLKSVVTDIVDAPFSEYGEKLVEIASYDAGNRYRLIEKTGETLDLLKKACGENSRWKWSFVELEGQYAAVAKNILDLKNVMVNTDPRSPHYEPTVLHLRKVKELLGRAADRYREKYEMATNHIDDFQKGINFLSSLRRIHILTGHTEDAETIRKKFEVWSAKLKTDIKNNKTRGL